MNRARLVFVFFAVSLTSCGVEPAPTDGWSEPVDGLRARLVYTEGTVEYGDRFPEVYLELHNVSKVASPMFFDFDLGKSIHFELQTARGIPAPKPIGSAVDMIVLGQVPITLPHDGTLRFPLRAYGYGIQRNFGTMFSFENAFWQIPYSDRTTYFLSATIEIPKTERDEKWGPRWHGVIKLPPVKAATSK